MTGKDRKKLILKKLYGPLVLKAKARQTLKVTGRWDATEFAYQSNKNYRSIATAESTLVSCPKSV